MDICFDVLLRFSSIRNNNRCLFLKCVRLRCMRFEYCFSINIAKMVYRSMAVRSRQFWEHSTNQKELAVIPHVEKEY